MGIADRPYSGHGGGGGWRPTGGGWQGSRGGALAQFMTPWVKRLLIANFAVYLLMAMGLVPGRWAIDNLGFSPASFLTHPWSPITYMFVHGSFWHVFFNMVGVFFFGPPLERDMGSEEFIRFYLLCGLGAALASFALISVLGSPMVIGASGAVFGLMLAFALKWPNMPIYIWGVLPIKAKWLVGILAVMALLGTRSAAQGTGGGNVAHWTHLGGFVTAFLYIRYSDRVRRSLRRGKMRASGLSVASPAARGESEPRGRRHGGVSEDSLDETDRILDKIKEHGIDSLSDAERKFLDEMSRKYRGGT
jgi:rhomboid family protein